jgi:hypothetical protein
MPKPNRGYVRASECVTAVVPRKEEKHQAKAATDSEKPFSFPACERHCLGSHQQFQVICLGRYLGSLAVLLLLLLGLVISRSQGLPFESTSQLLSIIKLRGRLDRMSAKQRVSGAQMMTARDSSIMLYCNR